MSLVFRARPRLMRLATRAPRSRRRAAQRSRRTTAIDELAAAKRAAAREIPPGSFEPT